jgi:hypothetical protein
MSEIFDIISAVNRLKEQVAELISRIDYLCKYPSLIASDQYVDEQTACKLLHLSSLTLWRMRQNGEITFTRSHRKILYSVSSIRQYLDNKSVIANVPPKIPDPPSKS